MSDASIVPVLDTVLELAKEMNPADLLLMMEQFIYEKMSDFADEAKHISDLDMSSEAAVATAIESVSNFVAAVQTFHEELKGMSSGITGPDGDLRLEVAASSDAQGSEGGEATVLSGAA